MCDSCEGIKQPALGRRTLLGGAVLGATVAAWGSAMPSAAATARTSKLQGVGLHLLGTSGGPVWYPGSDRAGTSTAISVDDAVYLFDLGDGALHRYREAGLGRNDQDFVGFEQLRAAFVTHLHPDHYADLLGLYLFAPVMGLARGAYKPIPLLGPGWQ